MKNTSDKAVFAPQLFIPPGVKDISFYLNAFGAVENKIWRNDDGTVHVAEISINGTIFYLHEERPEKGQLEPSRAKGVTALIGLFVDDTDSVINSALKAGATLLNPARDYDYGYRQGDILDPFGHQWMIEMKITFYHGTRADLKAGDLIEPGYNSNYGSRKKALWVYLTATLDAAVWGAELASGKEPSRIYIVEPTGPFEDDPNLTDKRFPGNPTKSYRSRHALRVIGEITSWQGHSPERMNEMKEHLDKLQQQGIEAIED